MTFKSLCVVACLSVATAAQVSAQAQPNPAEVRALIGEQQAFVRALAQNRQQGNVWLVQWQNTGTARQNGTATGGLAAADQQFFTAKRAEVARQRFMTWADSQEPGLRRNLDAAFATVLSQDSRNFRGTSQQYVDTVVVPLKSQQMRQLLDLLHRATARLAGAAQAARLPDLPLVASAGGVAPTLPPPVAPPGTNIGLLGQTGGIAGRPVNPPVVQPPVARPPAVLPGPSGYQPGYAGQVMPGANGNVTLVLDPRTVAMIFQALMAMQAQQGGGGFTNPGQQWRPPVANPGQMWTGQQAWPGQQQPGQVGFTGSPFEQALRASGIRVVFRTQ